jgi:hypothetical protein
MAGPEESTVPINPVRVSIGNERLADFSLGRSFETYRVELPPDMAERFDLERSSPVLTLETRTWRPANWIQGAADIRDLGVRIDWIEVR